VDAAGTALTVALSTVGGAAQAGGVIAAALLAGLVLLARGPRARASAMLGALALTPILLVASIWSTPQLETLRGRPLLALAAVLGGLVVLGIGARVFHRRPELFVLSATAALPFRVPIESGGETASLLIPLYLVIAAGGLSYALARLRATGWREDPEPEPERPTGWLEWLLSGSIVLYALQATYSIDFDRALSQEIFFYVPFALLFALLVRVRWTPRLAGSCLLVLLVLAVVFVGVGFVEYAKRELLLNPKVISANQFDTYFRVNSLFFDPSIYGRFLATVMLGLTAVLLWGRRTDVGAACALALALLLAGLVMTLSQSSFAALLAGLAVLGGLRWGRGRALTIAGGLVLAAVLVVLAAPRVAGLDQPLKHATSGRSNLIRGGVELFADRPLIGYGAGGFRREYRNHHKGSTPHATAASHTIAVTVAAEQGLVGLGLYLALIAVAIARLLRAARRDATRAAIAAAFIALVVHTQLYAAFLEDPLAWALLAVGAALGGSAPAGGGSAAQRAAERVREAGEGAAPASAG
jgi:putative inorganic carbon (HCO3(-)) transporter